MFANPAADAKRQRATQATQRERVHATADAIYRAVHECAEPDIVAALLQQLRALTATRSDA